MYEIGKEMFVKCFTSIPLPPWLSLEIKNGKDNFIPKGFSKTICISFGLKC